MKNKDQGSISPILAGLILAAFLIVGVVVYTMSKKYPANSSGSTGSNMTQTQVSQPTSAQPTVAQTEDQAVKGFDDKLNNLSTDLNNTDQSLNDKQIDLSQ